MKPMPGPAESNAFPRFSTKRTVWLELAARLAAEITYPNFKSEVAKSNGDPEYGELLHDVWQAGADFQDRVEYPSA